ncbi:LTA synthase family protein [Salipaludibacillus daqingensis]|uniref:LTA synthase family protein n=1 Tax=Salipaludibacillus daqingensis TaxID=3041001 RepID=UPI00247449E4|nr:LTA synthase family protein [Salipaludibacillus daqingensis]
MGIVGSGMNKTLFSSDEVQKFMRNFVRNHRFLFLCFMTLWLKTVMVSTIIFHVNPVTVFQKIIFMINPLSFMLIAFAIGLVFKETFQRWYLFILSVFMTMILYSNAVYFREFTDIITLPMLVMSGNAGDLTSSIFELIRWYDVLFFVDIIVFAILLWKKRNWLTVTQMTCKENKVLFATAILLALVIIGLAQLEKPHNIETKRYTFDREWLIQRYGLYNFYVYDAFIHTRTEAKSILREEDAWNEISEHLMRHRKLPNEIFHKLANQKNVVVISMESVESFVIDETIDGKEITPFLNRLIEESYYFPNFYDQTAQGKTSDAEFLVNTSLYPLGRGAVFHTHSGNEYMALPEILRHQGYYTASLHANDRTFYNREMMYDALGYEDYYSESSYTIDETNSVGWGLKDVDFFHQSMNYLQEFPEPFYATLLTLTNHFPYELDEEDHFIDPYTSSSNVLNRYFPTVRYTDEAVRLYFEAMKEAGLYENTIFVLYGDHFGIAESHNKAMGEFLNNKDINEFENVLLNRVPLIIHIPGQEGEIRPTVGGKVDIKPTLLNLLGLPESPEGMFGTDLFSTERESFVALTDGTVVTDEFVYSGETCYDAELETETSIGLCDPIRERADWEMFYSDKIIYGDLLRFR